MKSPTLLKLEQQFLKSLRTDKNSPWLESIIIPAHHRNTEEVLDLYLNRARTRTIAPFHEIFPACEAIMGSELFDRFVDDFYLHSHCDNVTVLDYANSFMDYLTVVKPEFFEPLIPTIEEQKIDWSRLLIDVALTEWRLRRAETAPTLRKNDPEELLHRLRVKKLHGYRPKLEHGTRIPFSCYCLIPLTKAHKCPIEPRHLIAGERKPYLIWRKPDNQVEIRTISEDEARLLRSCNGHLSVTAILQEETHFGFSREETLDRISEAIKLGWIVSLFDPMSYQ